MSETSTIDLPAQIAKLATYILDNDLMPMRFEGGAVDCAIAIIKADRERIAALEGERDRAKERELDLSPPSEVLRLRLNVEEKASLPDLSREQTDPGRIWMEGRLSGMRDALNVVSQAEKRGEYNPKLIPSWEVDHGR